MSGFLDDIPKIDLGRRERKPKPAAPPGAEEGNNQSSIINNQSVPAFRHGLKCPRCGHTKWETLATRRIPGGVRRYRVCKNCGRQVKTREKIDRQ